MQGNRLEDGLSSAKMVEGKLVADPSELHWIEQGAMCMGGCGQAVQGRTSLKRADIEAAGGKEAQEAFIVASRAPVRSKVQTMGFLCPDCRGRTKAHSLDFGQAICALKAGERMARRGWNGKGMWLVLVKPEDMRGTLAGVPASKPWGNLLPLLPWLGMRTADAHFVPWLASQTDVLAEDWEVV